MGGIFGVVGKNDCVMDLFFGVDYHSHLGTRRAGMAVFDGEYFNRVIHNIQNSPFRTKFEKDVEDLRGYMIQIIFIICCMYYRIIYFCIRYINPTYNITVYRL